MMLSQTSETVMLFVDRLFLSRVGKVHLAAAMSGGLTSFVLTSFFTGMVGYVNAMVAQFYGAGRRSDCARAETQALYLSLVSYPFLLLCLPFTKYLFSAVGLDPAQIQLTEEYIGILLTGSILVLLRIPLGSFFIGIGKTKVVMMANIAAMVVNIPVNYVFIFGKLGFPALGMRGAALGTLCGQLSALLILSAAYLKTIKAEGYWANGIWRINRALLRRLARFGLPAGVEIFLNTFAFNLFVQLMHSYGQNVAAAVTIAFNYDIVSFIPMLGLGWATTALVGQCIGAKDQEGAEKSAYLSLRLALGYSALMVLLFTIGAKPLVSLFVSGFTDPGGEIAALATTLVRLVSIYTAGDAMQMVFAGSLRGGGDTAWVMRFSAIMHWGMAGMVLLLTRVFTVNPLLVWGVFILMVVILGFGTLLRFRAGKWKNISLID